MRRDGGPVGDDELACAGEVRAQGERKFLDVAALEALQREDAGLAVACDGEGGIDAAGNVAAAAVARRFAFGAMVQRDHRGAQVRERAQILHHRGHFRGGIFVRVVEANERIENQQWTSFAGDVQQTRVADRRVGHPAQ